MPIPKFAHPATPQNAPTDYGTPIRSGRIFDLLHLWSVLLVLSSM